MNITFTDGVKFNTDCKPQIVRKSDGLYVIGNGILIPVNSIKEAKEELNNLLCPKKIKSNIDVSKMSRMKILELYGKDLISFEQLMSLNK